MVDGKIIFSSQNLMIKIMYNIYQLTTRKFNKVKELSNQTIMNTYLKIYQILTTMIIFL